MSPVPTVNQAYAMILNNEGQKVISTNSARLLGAAPSSYDPTILYAKTEYQKHKKDYSIQCDFCKMKGHLKEKCYRLVGYPNTFKKKRGENGGGTRRAYNVHTESFIGQRANQGQGNQLMENVTGLYQRQEQCLQGLVIAGMQPGMQRGTCIFTKDQYDQLTQLLNNNKLHSSENATVANVESTYGILGKTTCKDLQDIVSACLATCNAPIIN